MKLFRTKQIDLNSIIINSADIILYLDKNVKKTPKKNKKAFSLNAIPIKGLGGMTIDKIDFLDISLSLLDFGSRDTIVALKKLHMQLDSIGFERNMGPDTTFRIKMADLDIKLLAAHFPRLVGDYDLSFDELFLQTKDSSLSITNLRYRPLTPLKELAITTKFQQEFYDIKIREFKTDISRLKNILSGGDLNFSAVDIDSMEITIYKDKRKPFDESRRPKFPNQLLKQLKQPLSIGAISINNSNFIYCERHDKIEVPMTLTFSDLNLKIEGVTSVKKDIEDGATLTFDLSAKMQKEIPFELFMEFPLSSVSDTFSFQGVLGSGELEVFNPILMPVLGLKLESGKLESLKFLARANPNYSLGEMTMLYKGLKGEKINLKKNKSNALYSWVVNSVIYKDNPISGDPIRTTALYTERVNYKGLGNFIWKTTQSGIMGTIVPTQNNNSVNKQEKQLGFTKEQIKKRKKREKRDRRSALKNAKNNGNR